MRIAVDNKVHALIGRRQNRPETGKLVASIDFKSGVVLYTGASHFLVVDSHEQTGMRNNVNIIPVKSINNCFGIAVIDLFPYPPGKLTQLVVQDQLNSIVPTGRADIGMESYNQNIQFLNDRFWEINLTINPDNISLSPNQNVNIVVFLVQGRHFPLYV